MLVRSLAVVGILLTLLYPVRAQSSLGLAPTPCAAGGFGLPTLTFGNQFRVARPIRVTHLCHLAIQPTDPITPVVELWTTGASPTLLGTAIIGAQLFGTFCLTGSNHPARMAATAITPVDLIPGDYVVRQTTTHWWFETTGCQAGAAITFLNSVYGGFTYHSSSCVFGPSFVYEPLSAAVTSLGAGCAGSLGVPALSATPPVLGQTATLTCNNLPSGSPAWMLLGLSDTSWNGLPLPLALDGLGMIGCMARVSVDLSAGGLASGGVLALGLPVPANAATAGGRLHVQTLALDLGANPFGAVVSNALTLTLGY